MFFPTTVDHTIFEHNPTAIPFIVLPAVSAMLQMSQQGEEHREQVMLSTQKWELETQALKEEVQQLKADLAATTRVCWGAF